jgi:hypothetical protein
MRYAVLHTIRVGQKVAQRKVRLVVTGVPERTDRDKVIEVLEAAGRAADFSEAGIAWGNHDVKDADHLPAGTTDLDSAPTVDWSSMIDDREVRRITLRLDKELYAGVVLAASRANQRIQGWCEETLRDAVHRASTHETTPPTPPATTTPSHGTRQRTDSKIAKPSRPRQARAKTTEHPTSAEPETPTS